MPERTMLTVNSGSSSLKAAVFDADDLTDRHMTALVEQIGHESALRVSNSAGEEIADKPVVFAFHRYQRAIHEIIHGRVNPERFPCAASTNKAPRPPRSIWWC